MILKLLSKHIETEIKRNDPEGTVSVEVMAYALGIKLNLIVTVVLTTRFRLDYGTSFKLTTSLGKEFQIG